MSEDMFVEPELDMFDPEVQRKAEVAQYDAKLTEEQKVRDYINRVSLAYKRLFGDPNRSEDAKVVMEDLAFWSRAFEPTWNENQKKQDLLEGRRETYNRIARYTRLSLDQLFKIYMDAKTRTMD